MAVGVASWDPRTCERGEGKSKVVGDGSNVGNCVGLACGPCLLHYLHCSKPLVWELSTDKEVLLAGNEMQPRIGLIYNAIAAPLEV